MREIQTGLEGFRLWPDALSAQAQAALLAEVLMAEAVAPFYRPETPGGRPFSVQMTNLGGLGWGSDRGGYRYQETHPATGKPWPPIPRMLLNLWSELTGWPEPPDACLVNLYRDQAKMGLHQDRDEADLTAVGRPLMLEDPGFAFKLFPCQYGTHFAVTAALEAVSAGLTTEKLTAALAKVTLDKVSASAAAAELLTQVTSG